MVIALRHTPRVDGSVRELSAHISRLIVLIGAVLFWACVGLVILTLT